MERILSARGLEKSYKGRTVVHGVDLELHSGEVIGLLGGGFVPTVDAVEPNLTD